MRGGKHTVLYTSGNLSNYFILELETPSSPDYPYECQTHTNGPVGQVSDKLSWNFGALESPVFY